MINARFVRGADGIDYNNDGDPVFPKLGGDRAGVASIVLCLTFPFFVISDKWGSAFSIGILRSARLFEVALSARLLSERQVATADLFLIGIVMFTILSVIFYLRNNLAKFSGVRPPTTLKRRWLRQIVLMFGIGLFIFTSPFVIG